MYSGIAWLASIVLIGLLSLPEAGAESNDVYPGAENKRNNETATLESVIVTARRRSERAEDVPIPVAVISAAELAESGQFRFEDLNRHLPSTNIQFVNPRQTSVTVRGLGNNPANDALESSVGVYLDNVYLGRSGMANLDLIDIEQITLLRGAQGTLFGKNTTAGVVNITTRAPTFTPEAQIEASFGNFDFYQIRGAISGPIVDDTLAWRLSVAKTVKDGFLHNLYDGRALNGVNRSGVRGQLLFEQTAFSLRFIGDYHEEHSECCASVLVNPGPNDGALFLNTMRSIGANVPLDPNLRTTNLDSNQRVDVRQGGASVEMNYHVDDYTFTSITAYRNWWYLPTSDFDNINLPALINTGQHVDDEQWTQELRITSPTNRAIEYLAGLYYFYQYASNDTFMLYGPAAGAFTGRPALNNAYTQTNQYLHTDSYSLFAQAEWRVSDVVSLTGGVRDTREIKSTHVHRIPPSGGSTSVSPTVTDLLFAFDSGDLERRDDNVSWLLSLAVEPSPALLWYASIAQGAKSGGINPSVPNPTLGVSSLYIDPEIARDGEVGFKSTLFNRRVTVNANLFWTDVRHYQATQLLEVSPGVYTQALSNIGRVRTRGAEVEFTAVPVDGLRLGLTGSYNDAVYRDYSNAPCAAELTAAGFKTCSLSGQPLVGAPKWIINPSASYAYRVGDHELHLQADYAWRSDFFGSFDNSQLARVEATGVLNARLGFTCSLGGRRYEISAWGRNLLDEVYVVGGVTGAGTYLNYNQYRGEPRTYGITFSASI